MYLLDLSTAVQLKLIAIKMELLEAINMHPKVMQGGDLGDILHPT
jgi:hypothetical protein